MKCNQFLFIDGGPCIPFGVGLCSDTSGAKNESGRMSSILLFPLSGKADRTSLRNSVILPERRAKTGDG